MDNNEIKTNRIGKPIQKQDQHQESTIIVRVDNNRRVDVDELNQILEQLQNKSNPSQTTITICFNEDVDFINIVFIAGLFLYYQIHETPFILQMTEGKYAFQWGTKYEKRINEVKQYIEQTIKIYKVRDSWIKLFNETIDLSRQDFTISTEFVPILLIDEKSHKQLFENPNDEENRNASNSLTEYTIRQLSQKYRQKITDEINNTGVGRAYFRYCETERKNSIVTLLESFSHMNSIVFFIFLKKISYIEKIRTNNEGILKDDDAEIIIRRFDELLSFTNDYVIGLRELSKNIVDHCSSRKGIITIRAYLNEDESNEKKIDTYVFDFGEKGVIPTLIDNTKMNEEQIDDEVLKKDYKDDLLTLENDFDFKDFIFPTKNKILYQQIRRSIAHYGLFQFFYLIKKLQGYAHAYSINSNKIRDDFYYPANVNVRDRTINNGTSYFFSFPAPSIQYESTKKTESKQNELEPQQSSVELVDDLLEIASCKILRNPTSINNSEKTIFVESSEVNVDIADRTSEQEYYVKHISKYEKINNPYDSYLIIDLTRISLTPSQLLRLLFKTNMNVMLPIIVYNINSSTLINMIDLNQKQFDIFNILTKKYPYWIEDKAVMVYSHYTGQNGKFIFADLLYGLTSHDYYYTNRIVSNTHPNLTSIINDVTQQNDDENRHPNFNRPPLDAFFSNSIIKPFDILPIDNEFPLFIQNLSYLLNKEIVK